MNTPCFLPLVAVAGLALGARCALADPVASADNAWLPLTKSALQPPKDARERRGQEVFQERCAACHAPVPQNMIGPPYMPVNPGTQALKARYKDAKPAELEARTDLTAPFVAAIVRNGLNSMPFFRPTELSDDDLAAVGAYLARKR